MKFPGKSDAELLMIAAAAGEALLERGVIGERLTFDLTEKGLRALLEGDVLGADRRAELIDEAVEDALKELMQEWRQQP